VKIAFFGDSITEGLPGTAYIELLREKLSGHELLNFGKGGDTVLSLFKRIQNLDLPENLDISFVWVGVNDVIVKTSWIYPWLRRMRRQQWSRSVEEFRSHYRGLLDFLSVRTMHLLTAPPLFIGEDVGNEWNRRLEDLSRIISEQTDVCSNGDFIDLRGILFPLLAGKDVCPFVPTTGIQAVRNVLFGSSQDNKDDQENGRELFYTIDGIHLNNEGARIVADVLFEAVQRKITDS
jgi:lysophospholipase L1-like esterase